MTGRHVFFVMTIWDNCVDALQPDTSFFLLSWQSEITVLMHYSPTHLLSDDNLRELCWCITARHVFFLMTIWENCVDKSGQYKIQESPLHKHAAIWESIAQTTNSPFFFLPRIFHFLLTTGNQISDNCKNVDDSRAWLSILAEAMSEIISEMM